MTRLPTRSGAAWPATSEHPTSPLDRFFGGILRRLTEGPGGEEEGELAAADVDEDDEKVYVDVELPGFAKDEVDVRVDREVVTVYAERTAAAPRGRRHLGERRTRRARRSLTLPAVVDADEAEAMLRDGVLHLELPKAEQQTGRRIAVK